MNIRQLPLLVAFLLAVGCGGDDKEYDLAANNTGNTGGGGASGGGSGGDAGGDAGDPDPVPAEGVIYLTGAGDFVSLTATSTPLFASGSNIATGDHHIAPDRSALVWSDGAKVELAATDGSTRRTLTAPLDEAPRVASPRYSPTGDHVFLVAGTGSGAFTSSSIYRVPLNMDTAVPDKVSASAASCAVFRDIAVRSPSRVIAVRDACVEAGEAGLFEILTSTGTAEPLFRVVPNATGRIVATAMSADRGTVYAWAEGSFDVNGDLTADVEVTGIYAVDLTAGELTTWALELDGTVTSIAAGNGGVILGVQAPGGDQNLVAVALPSGTATALTEGGDARSPVTY